MAHARLKDLGRKEAAFYLRVLFVFMFAMLLMGFMPIIVQPDFIHSRLRQLFALCYIVAFIACTTIVFRAKLAAAASAELVVEKMLHTDQRRATFYMAATWTRWCAYAALAALTSSIFVQGSLFLWMYHGFPANSMRIGVDWLGALDLMLNAWCAASLSGIAGPSRTDGMSEAALKELSSLLAPEPGS